MSDLKQIETTNTSIKTPLPRESSSRTSHFCSNFAYKTSSYRIIIQCATLAILFGVITLAGTAVDCSDSTMVAAYVIGSLIFVLFDYCFFSRTAFLYRKAYILDLGGEYLSALALLEKIGPKSKRFIKTPIFAYHQLKALILAHSGQFHHAEAEAFNAEEAGLPFYELIQIRTNIYKSLGDFNKAQNEISNALTSSDTIVPLRIDQALLLIQARDYRLAKRTIQDIQHNVVTSIFAKDNSKLILSSLLGICDLWTGHAEEGIEALQFDLDELYLYSVGKEAVRPLASWCFLERAYYYATHREPALALIDTSVAQKLCLYPEHRQKIAEIKDELKSRHNM